MSIELRICDEDMMDLSGEDLGQEEESLPVAAPVQQEGNLSSDLPADDLVLKVQQLKRFYGVPEDLDSSKKWYDDIRLNVVHVEGVQDMSSDDLLTYFKAFDPSSLEWVNDKSCNVVFDDALTAARAMAKMTTHRIGSGESDATADLSLFPLLESDKLSAGFPDGQWLLGSEHEKAKQLLIRYAKPGDKKKAGAGKFSEYYRKYGNPHYGGKKQLMSGSLAEKLKKMSEMEGGLDEDDDDGDDVNQRLPAAGREDRRSESPPRRPAGLRMKMRADDEEEESGKPRSFNKFTSEKDKKSVWDRLEKPSVLDRIGNSSRVIQRKKGTGSESSSSLSVWSRLSLANPSSKKEGNKRNVLYSNIRIKK